MILPLLVLGRASAKRMSSGLAKPPISEATCALSFSANSGEASKPRSKVMNAAIASPLISSGLPTTAASATAGWLTSALSTSIVPRRWPETFSTSSTRPMIQK